MRERIADTRRPAPAPRARTLPPGLSNADLSRRLTRQAEAPAATALLVDDADEAQAGQMKLAPFLALLEERSVAAANEELGLRATLADVPSEVRRFLAQYRGMRASTLETAIRQQVPAAVTARSAGEYVDHITARVRAAVREHATAPAGGGEEKSAGERIQNAVTTGIQVVGEKLSSGYDKLKSWGKSLFSARPGASGGEPGGDLGAGHALEGAVRTRMEPLLGDLSHVRVHDEPPAQAEVDRLGARAFAVGGHVAFGPGQYRPGTPAGDALIAHELAHTVQQAEGAAAAPPSALEADADSAAAAAVGALHAGAPARRLPRLRSAVALQRCSKDAPQSGTAPPQATVAPPPGLPRLDPATQWPELLGPSPATDAERDAVYTVIAANRAAGMPTAAAKKQWRVQENDEARRFHKGYSFGGSVNEAPDFEAANKGDAHKDAKVRIQKLVWAELGSGEGYTDAIQTYDTELLSVGRGFGFKSGPGREILEELFEKAPATRTAMLRVGFTIRNHVPMAVRLPKDGAGGGIATGDAALHEIELDLGVLATMAGQLGGEKTKEVAATAQLNALKKQGRAAGVPDAIVDDVSKWNDNVIKYVAHAIHFAPAHHSWTGAKTTTDDGKDIKPFGKQVLDKSCPKYKATVAGTELTLYLDEGARAMMFGDFVFAEKLDKATDDEAKVAGTLTKLGPANKVVSGAERALADAQAHDKPTDALEKGLESKKKTQAAEQKKADKFIEDKQLEATAQSMSSSIWVYAGKKGWRKYTP